MNQPNHCIGDKLSVIDDTLFGMKNEKIAEKLKDALLRVGYLGQAYVAATAEGDWSRVMAKYGPYMLAIQEAKDLTVVIGWRAATLKNLAQNASKAPAAKKISPRKDNRKSNVYQSNRIE